MIAAAATSALGLVAEIGRYVLGWPDAPVETFSLSYERNVPTWVASALLLVAALELARCAEHASRDVRAWWSLAAIFAFLSLDETIELHERLGGLFEGRGVLYFGWIVPAAFLVVLLGLSFLGLLRGLETADRRRFVLAGALYVSGALGMELPLGWWAERAGDDNLAYGLIDWLEESLELTGAAYFVLALRARSRRASS